MNQKTATIVSSFGLILATMIWGFAFVVVKNSLDFVPPIYMLAFRFTIAAIALSLIFLKKFKGITKQSFFQGILLGLFLFLAYAFQTIGCKYTTAGKNAFITTFYVVLVPFLSWIISKKRPNLYNIIAAVIAILGLGLLSLQGDFSVNIGDILTLICGIWYAIHIVYISKFNQKTDPVLLTVLQLATAAILSWITAPFYDGAFPLQSIQNSSVILSMLYLGLLSTMVAFLLQNVCQKFVTPSTTSLLLSFEAVFGALSSCIFLKEVLTIRMIIGCILIFFAVLLSETHFEFITKHFSKQSSLC